MEVTTNLKHNAVATYKGKYCVYRHYINGVIFYVGKWVGDRPFECYQAKRNCIWHKMVDENAGVFDVEIYQWFDTQKEARLKETQEIKFWKPAANQSQNGYSRVASDETRAKIRSSIKIKSQSNKPKNDNKAISNPRNRPQFRIPIQDLTTGIFYSSITEAAKSFDTQVSTIQAHLSGRTSHVRGRKFQVAHANEYKLIKRDLVVGKQIEDVDTGIRYVSIRLAGRESGVSRSTIKAQLDGKINKPRVNRFRYITEGVA